MIGPLLAHAGAGSTWQAAVVVAAVALAICVALATLDLIPMSAPEDLLIPGAATAIAASVAPLGRTLFSDGIGWGVPLAAVSLVALLLAVFTPLDLTPSSPLALGSLALAGVTMYLLYAPLTVALHPPVDLLPLADDSEITIVSPSEGSVVDAGNVDVTVEVTGGSIGAPAAPLEELSPDPEEAASLQAFVNGDPQELVWDDGCTVDDPCSSVSFEVTVPPGESQLTVEFVRGDGAPFAPLVVDRVTFTGE
jgi:hypothetical protein